MIHGSGIASFEKFETDEHPCFDPIKEDVRILGQMRCRLADSDSPPSVSQMLSCFQENGKMPGAETVKDFYEAFCSAAVTPLVIAHRVIDAIHDSSDSLHAFTQVNEDDIIKQATLSSARYQKGEPLSILDGVPVAIKDEIDVLPYYTTFGSTPAFHNLPTKDSVIAEKFREAGAVIVGKTNMHEVGIGTTGANVIYGTVRNPYNTQFHTGGSSSGSAAAVSAGICPIAIGSDGGGSVRIPAALCGIFGLKPTKDVINMTGTAALHTTICSIGVLGKTVGDVIAGFCAATGDYSFSRISRSNIGEFRIGVFKPWFEDSDEEVYNRCYAALEEYKPLGAKIVEVKISMLQCIRWAHIITIISESIANVKSMGRKDSDIRGMSYEARILLSLSRYFSSADYVKAQKVRRAALKMFKDIFHDVDVIATPSTCIVAPKIVQKSLPQGEVSPSLTALLMKYSFVANFLGLPAISIPVGYDIENHLPIGLQFMGPHYSEALLLHLAFMAEGFVHIEEPSVIFSPSLE